MKNLVVCLFAGLFLLSCEKAELPRPAHDPGNVSSATVDMEQNYRWQIYYDLSSNRIISQNLKSSWDLGFETSANGYRIILNASKAMFARNTNDTSFAAVNDTSGFALSKVWDAPSGNMDSTAIGNWQTQHVYVIDRGYNENGQPQGFRKIKIESVSASAYSIRFANLNGSGETVFSIPKDSAYNFTFFSFNNNGQLVNVEPPKREWDLVFTQYIHTFYNPTMPYLVTGCLLNRFETAAARDTTGAFVHITYQQAFVTPLSSGINTIGYDWKTFNGTTYTTNPALNFIIRDAAGVFYKLHFTDFYNDNGMKGNPKWEFQRL